VLNPVKWNPEAINYEYIKEKHAKVMDNKSMTLIANRTSIVEVLKNTSETAYAKFKAKAYLHWYY
jgi:hypothetical protein